MSYGQKFKGKLVWGTPVFRILLESTDQKLKPEFSGVLTLFERRHEKSSFKFKSLEEFVSTIRQLWKESLKSDSVQDTRLSRWIEEYLQEINIRANYQDIMDAIKGEFIAVPALKALEAEDLSQELVDNILPPTAEFMAYGNVRKIEGDFNDKEELNKILQKFMDENKPERKTHALTKATFTTPDGQERSIEDRKQMEESPLADVVNLNSGFHNEFGMEIKDISFTDIVPFDYKIKDIKISGVEAVKLGEEVTKDGLEVKWQIDSLQVGQKSDIEYELGKRMLRTILIRDDFDLTILQTYENINREDNSVWVESTYVFQDNTPIVENVKILDQIPGEYKLVDSTPEAIPPLAQVRTSNQSTEIAWSYTDVPASTQFVLTYELGTTPKLLRDIAQIYNNKDELIARAVRILRPKQDNSQFGVVMAIKPLKPITSMSIIDVIPNSFGMKQIEVPFGVVAELEDSDTKKIVWKVDNIPINETIQAVLEYSGTDSYSFDQFSIESTEGQSIKEDIQLSLKKGEKVSLPDALYT